MSYESWELVINIDDNFMGSAMEGSTVNNITETNTLLVLYH